MASRTALLLVGTSPAITRSKGLVSKKSLMGMNVLRYVSDLNMKALLILGVNTRDVVFPNVR